MGIIAGERLWIIRRDRGEFWRYCDGEDHAQFLLEDWEFDGTPGHQSAEVVVDDFSAWWLWDSETKSLIQQPGAFVEGPHRLIRSASEKGYWCNNKGWVRRAIEATRFSVEESSYFDLPTGSGEDAQWVDDEFNLPSFTD